MAKGEERNCEETANRRTFEQQKAEVKNRNSRSVLLRFAVSSLLPLTTSALSTLILPKKIGVHSGIHLTRNSTSVRCLTMLAVIVSVQVF